MEQVLGFILEGITEGVVNTLVFASIGFLYLYLRYRNRIRVRRILIKEYDTSYTNAGQVVVLNTVAAIGILLVVGLIIATLV